MKIIKTKVLVIGGGPAGSTLGSYLAKENIDCLIIEKEKFPREHVGESLVITCNRIFDELDLEAELEKANFPKKYGAAWTNTTNHNVFNHDWTNYDISESVSINFNDRKQSGLNTEYTYHVDRGLFDEILLNKSRQFGARVLEETFITNVIINEDKVICTASQNGEKLEIHAEMIADASGRATVLGRILNIKENDPDFNQLAIHTWYENYDRDSDPYKDFIYIHFLPFSHTWVWQIPITESITSIGLVTHKDHIKNSRKKLDEIFSEFLSTHPNVATRVENATRIRPFKMEADYSYKMKQMTGDRFVLVGDAARYVDPIFSSGVSIALNGARIVASDIIAAIKNNNFQKDSFSKYELTMQAGCKNWYDFITLYYKLNVMFTWFVANDKYKSEVLRFLQGDVYDTNESFLISDMRKMSEEIERNPNHVLHQYLNNEFKINY